MTFDPTTVLHFARLLGVEAHDGERLRSPEEIVGEAGKDQERLRGAIETLVHDEIISSGRARELHGMTTDQQREHWRDRCTLLPAIQLEISPDGTTVVRIEIEKTWIRVIKELHIGGVTNTIVEPLGIRSAIDAARQREGG